MEHKRITVTDLGRSCTIRNNIWAARRGRLYRIVEILPFSNVDSIVSDAHSLEILFKFARLAETINIPALGKKYIEDAHLIAVLCFFEQRIQTARDVCVHVNGAATAS